MADDGDMLTGLDALVERTGRQEQALRDYLLALSERLRTVCSRADIYCESEYLTLEECGDDEHVSGYILCTSRGLEISHFFSGDACYLGPDEPIQYGITTVADCSLTWLRAICRREFIEAFLIRVQEQVLQRTDELRTRVVELTSLAMPPDYAAAADSERLAGDLGFGTIAGDWRAAQIKTVLDPEDAILSACTMVESVCKHILEACGLDAEGDLAALVKSTRKTLRLDSDPDVDEPLQRIVGGLAGAVGAIGTLRNRASAAHGKGITRLAVTPAHAKLAVNASGAIVTYLLERYKVVRGDGS